MQGSMILEYTFKDNAYAELYGDNIKYWIGTGLPDFEGSIDAFKTVFPKHFQQLLDACVIKEK